jgi:hypothetical protein
MPDEARTEEETGVSERYEPPRLTRIGNVRDMLAGDHGSLADGDPMGEFPTRSGGMG